MPDATTFAELFGGVFPTEPQVEIGVVYGPLGDDLTGTAVLADAAQLQILDTLALLGIEGTWAIQRTFETTTGDKIPGVRVSLVGVANKSSTSGSNGVAQIKIDDGTYTLRTVVPVGYEDVPDVPVVISGADDVGVVVLTEVSVAAADAPLCGVAIYVFNQYGVPLNGATIEARFIRFNTGATPGQVVLSPSQTFATNSNGLAQINLYRSAFYTIKITSGTFSKAIEASIPDAESFSISESV
jgi:hypothetical protein